MSPETELEISIIIPTYNSASTIVECLRSVINQTVPCEIIVVDNYSTDETIVLAQAFTNRILIAGPERSAQRNLGAKLAKSSIVGFVDSDMILESSVAENVLWQIDAGVDAVIVPEVSIGVSFWARVRAFERQFYIGSDSIEAVRFLRLSLFESMDGFDESLNAGEDWDLTSRLRQVAVVGRIGARIFHNEGNLGFAAACRKKANYADGLSVFIGKHGVRSFLAKANRPYVKRPWLLFQSGVSLGVGVIVLKSAETLLVFRRLLWLLSVALVNKLRKSVRILLGREAIDVET